MTGAQSYVCCLGFPVCTPSCNETSIITCQCYSRNVLEWASVAPTHLNTGVSCLMPWGSQNEMETESESSSLGDDSVFWLDSEVITQLTDDDDEEREENFRWLSSSCLNPLSVCSLVLSCPLSFNPFFSLLVGLGWKKAAFQLAVAFFIPQLALSL